MISGVAAYMPVLTLPLLVDLMLESTSGKAWEPNAATATADATMLSP